MKFFNTPFVKAAGERALKTFAQTLIASLTISSAPLDVLHANWVADLSLALGATALSVLTSLASLTSLGPDQGAHSAA